MTNSYKPNPDAWAENPSNPALRQKDREKIAQQTADFLAKGKQIKTIPRYTSVNDIKEVFNKSIIQENFDAARHKANQANRLKNARKAK